MSLIDVELKTHFQNFPWFVEARFPYDENAVRQIKQILGATWVPRTRRGTGLYWKIPLISLALLTERPRGLHFLAEHDINRRIAELRSAMIRVQELKENTQEKIHDISYLSIFPHQQHGVRVIEEALRHFGGFLLADDMGLGKTIQAIATATRVGDSTAKVLVTCIPSDVPNWERELKTFEPELSVQVIKGSAEKRHELWNVNAQVFVCHHDLLWREIDHMPRVWDLLIRDEATAFKTEAAARTRAVKKLNAMYRLDLTGTPVENNLEEMRTLFDWLIPGLLGNSYQFAQRFGIKDFWGTVYDYRDKNIIQQRIAPFFLRREMDSTLDLPEKLDHSIFVDFAEDEDAEYQKIVDQAVEWLEETHAVGIQLSAGFMTLRRFISDPMHLGYDEMGAKQSELDNFLKKARRNDHRVVCFCFFRSTAERIAERYSAPLILGGMEAYARDEIITNFNESGAPLLVTTDASNRGKNITGADTVVHFDALYNPAMMAQREGRIRRIGQSKTQHVVKLIVRKSLDERVYETLHKKKELFTTMTESVSFSKEMWRLLLKR